MARVPRQDRRRSREKGVTGTGDSVHPRRDHGAQPGATHHQREGGRRSSGPDRCPCASAEAIIAYKPIDVVDRIAPRSPDDRRRGGRHRHTHRPRHRPVPTGAGAEAPGDAARHDPLRRIRPLLGDRHADDGRLAEPRFDRCASWSQRPGRPKGSTWSRPSTTQRKASREVRPGHHRGQVAMPDGIRPATSQSATGKWRRLRPLR